jgi:hypothetical protein
MSQDEGSVGGVVHNPCSDIRWFVSGSWVVGRGLWVDRLQAKHGQTRGIGSATDNERRNDMVACLLNPLSAELTRRFN